MESLLNFLLTEAGAIAGLLFLAIMGLCLAVRVLWRDYKEMQRRHEQKSMETIQEATRAFERMEGTIREQTKTIELIATRGSS